MEEPLASRVAVLSLLALILSQPSVVGACLHGATGIEQTAIMRGNNREEKLVGKWDGQSRSILKLFAGPPGVLPQVSLLDEAALKEHAELATKAAHIEGEGMRGGVAHLTYTTSTGIKVDVVEVTNRDWSDIAQHYGVPASGSDEVSTVPLWIKKVREERRGLFAVSIDMSAALQNPTAASIKDAYALAATFQYAGDDKAVMSAVLKDKFIEYWTAWNIPMIVRFASADGLADRLKAVIAADPDVNDPTPIRVSLEPGLGAAEAFNVALNGDSRVLGKVGVRGADAYFNNSNDVRLTPRGSQSAAAAPVAAPLRVNAEGVRRVLGGDVSNGN